MSVTIPSQNMIPAESREAYGFKTKMGYAQTLGGVIYAQYGASDAVASSTTETTLLKSSAGSIGSLIIPAGALASQYGLSTGSATGAGTHIRARLSGTIGNTSTPNIELKATLTAMDGSTVTALNDTGAIATAAITTGFWTLDWNCWVTAYSSTVGSFLSDLKFWYSTTTAASVTLSEGPTATSSFDTTAPYTLNFTVTWGTSSASNTITTKGVLIEMVN